MMKDTGRILAVDPGEKNIGIALSDPTETLAAPLTVVKHVSLTIDAAQVASLAEENSARLIIVGMPVGSQGEELPQTRHARKFIDIIKTQTSIPVEGWDEWGSTKQARETMIELGSPRSKRGGHQDALAAAMILRGYIEVHQKE
jgi:putative Holliday junction resolvase